jgi:phosphatidylserine/phosphatidylglycerophosphate/cardiolipin synthase-like enzyme
MVAAMKLVLNHDHYQAVLRELLPSARKFLWILTADIKDLYVEGDGGRFIPLLEVLAGKLREGVEVRLIHAKEPGPRFREDFDRFPEFLQSDAFDRLLCPRMHMKCILVDGHTAYIGSANLTGAGLGAKGENKRNFEAGVVTDDPATLRGLMDFLDDFYTGSLCASCERREYCPNPLA